jgi:hypothetical protein
MYPGREAVRETKNVFNPLIQVTVGGAIFSTEKLQSPHRLCDAQTQLVLCHTPNHPDHLISTPNQNIPAPRSTSPGNLIHFTPTKTE